MLLWDEKLNNMKTKKKISIIKKTVGITMLSAISIGLFVGTAWDHGEWNWGGAILAWAISFALVGLIGMAVFLIIDGSAT